MSWESSLPAADQDQLIADAPAEPAATPARAFHATRAQRFALIIGLLVAFWLALQLFASVLAPFVAAAVIAYALDPAATRLTRLGLPRGAAALLMILAVIAAVLLFALLLYPLVLVQIGLLVNRIPQYATLLQGWAREVTDPPAGELRPRRRQRQAARPGERPGGIDAEYSLVDHHRPDRQQLCHLQLLSLAVVTPVVGFYLLRDWPSAIRMVDSWLPYRYQGVIRAQAREVDRILSAWVRGQALCCLFLALYYAASLTIAGP